MDWFVGVIVDGLEGREGSMLTTSIYMSVAVALLEVQSMLRNVILSDGPTLWMLYVASCDGLENVQEY